MALMRARTTYGVNLQRQHQCAVRLPTVMPRHPRTIVPGVPVHITTRGVNRGPTFLTAEDYEFYRWSLLEAVKTADCAIHAYVLMTNHVHLLVTPAGSESAATLMRLVGLRYVRYFNHRYRRTGTLWEGRYRSAIVDTPAYLFHCSRYIEMNPVRAGLAAHPDRYHWSSFHTNALGLPDALVASHAQYVALGGSDEMRRRAYLAMFDTEIPVRVTAAIRAAQSGRSRLYRTLYQEMAGDMQSRCALPS